MKFARGASLASLVAVLVIACGHSSPTATSAFTFSPVNGTELPAARVNVSYSQTITLVSGGEPPYTFALTQTAGSLALAAVDSQSATLSGTFAPGQEGRQLVAFRVTDGKARVSNGSYTLRVDPATPALTLAPSALPNATRPMPYSTFVSVVGGVAPFTWSVNGLPPGLTFGTSTAATNGITGTPNTAGTFAVAVTVTDSSSPQRTGTITYSIVVN